jgi:hypothetical protein
VETGAVRGGSRDDFARGIRVRCVDEVGAATASDLFDRALGLGEGVGIAIDGRHDGPRVRDLSRDRRADSAASGTDDDHAPSFEIEL